MDAFFAVLMSLVIALAIVFSICYNTVDKWRFRADRQYPYVKELFEEWEDVTLRLLSHAHITPPEVRLADLRHPWQVAYAVNRLAEATPLPDFENPVTAPLLARQGELEEELETYLHVYNHLVPSYNKAVGRVVVRSFAKLCHWDKWEELNFNPTRKNG